MSTASEMYREVRLARQSPDAGHATPDSSADPRAHSDLNAKGEGAGSSLAGKAGLIGAGALAAGIVGALTARKGARALRRHRSD